MRVAIVDPSAFTRPYDHALSAALGLAGAEVELFTSHFAYGPVPAPERYQLREIFYRRAPGAPGSRLRRVGKLAEHVPDMLRCRRLVARDDVAHFQWLDVPWVDRHLLPSGPVVLTAHDLLPREPRPGQAGAQRRLYDRVDALIVHSDYGRRSLIDGLALDAGKVHVVPHGAFMHLTTQGDERPLPDELARFEGPVVLFFGLLRPYKGIETLLRAWHGIEGAELWIVGRPLMPLEPLRESAPRGVRFIPRFVSDPELPAFFRRADVVALPYARTEQFDQSGVLATALAFGRPTVLTDVGSFGEVAAIGAAQMVAPGDADELRDALRTLLDDASARERLARAARTAAAGPYSWDEAARQTLAVYRTVLA